MVIRADLHVHPLLGTWLFGRNATLRHNRPPFFLPVFSYVDYPRAYAAGVRMLCSVIYVLRLPWKEPMAEIEYLVRLEEQEVKNSAVPVRIVRTAKEIRQAASEGALAIMHVVEGGHVLGSDEANVDRLAALGVRYMTLVHFVHTRIGGAAAVPFGGKRGLTEFGRRIVRRMYTHGIVADVSHATVPTFWGVLEEAHGPVIATHSGARSYALRDRNLDAHQAQAIAQSGGVIGVILCPFYLKSWRLRGSLEDLLRTIDYFVNLVGADHVTLGSDLDGWLWPVREVRDIGDLWVVADALTRHGFSSSDVDLLMGESLVRMFERVDGGLEARGLRIGATTVSQQ